MLRGKKVRGRRTSKPSFGILFGPGDLEVDILQSCAKIFGKSMFFSFSWIYGLISPPYPHINVEKYYFCVARTGVIKITNIDMGERGEEIGKWGQNYRR